MLRSNAGLASRFPEEIEFAPFTVTESLQLLRRNLVEKQSYELAAGDSPAVCAAMQTIVASPVFASGRDMDTLATRIELAMVECEEEEEEEGAHSIPHKMMATTSTLVVPEAILLRMLGDFAAQQHRSTVASKGLGSPWTSHSTLPQEQLPPPQPYGYATDIHLTQHETKAEACARKDAGEEKKHTCSSVVRDPGVSEAVWRQLQLDAARSSNRDEEEEADVQVRLQQMNVCPSGYEWVRQEGCWRCLGGAHVVTDAQLDSA
jgi:hypothetical protein